MIPATGRVIPGRLRKPMPFTPSCWAVPLYPVPAAGIAAVLLTLALVPLVAAQSPEPPRFVAHTTDPTPLRGRLSAIADGWAVTLTDPNATIPAGRLVSLRREGRPLPPGPREPMIVLANGDRIRGDVTGGDTRTLRFAPPPRDGVKPEPWAVPLTALAAVWVTPPPADTPPDPAAYPWADGPRRRDAVLLRNGDVLRGTVEGFAADPPAVRVKTIGRPRRDLASPVAGGGGRVRSRPRPGPQAERPVRPARHRGRLPALARHGDRGCEHARRARPPSGPRSNCRWPTWSPSTCFRGRRRTCPT